MFGSASVPLYSDILLDLIQPYDEYIYLCSS
jgi:hypothetical protein